MVKHAKDRKRRSGRTKTTLKNRSWVRYNPKPPISNSVVKKNWDASKSAAENLRDMGLIAQPNQLAGGGKKGAPEKPEVIEVFDVPESDTPSRRQRFPLHREEEAYMVRCMTKHGDNYTKMFRDTKTNDMQHTEEKLRKWGARYLLLTSEQRRLPVPDKLKALLPDDSDESA